MTTTSPSAQKETTMSAPTDLLALHYLTIDEPALGRELLRQHGTAAATTEALEAEPTMLNGLHHLASRMSDARAYGLQAQQRADSVGATIVIEGDDLWPSIMADLGDNAPLALYVRGNADALPQWTNALAISGSRASTAYGNHIAGSIASLAADKGVPIVTGGAYGIDAAAMRAHLATGGAPQIVVMPGGIDRTYPAGHHELFESVLISDGALVSEFPPGAAPHRTRFLARNRLIAAARATVIVEAAQRSGALSTARRAIELGRPVGAVPGAITSATSGGCHRLIAEGVATLIHHTSDALDLLTQEADTEE